MNKNVDPMVEHPKHYILQNGIEIIDVIDGVTCDMHGLDATYTSHILKYLCRWNKKNGIQDLKKAQWYLERLINLNEKVEEKRK